MDHRSEKQKMLAGDLYLAADPELANPVTIGDNVWFGGGVIRELGTS